MEGGVSYGNLVDIERSIFPTSVNFECSKIIEYNIGVNEEKEVRFNINGKNDDKKRAIKFELNNSNISLSTSSWKAETEWVIKTKIKGQKVGETIITVKVEGKVLNTIKVKCINYKDVFSEGEIKTIKSFLVNNASKHGKKGHMDCITTVNHTLRLLLGDNLPVGSQMMGKDKRGRLGTMEKISNINKIKSSFTIDYLDDQGRKCNKGTPYKADRMEKKLSETINSMISSYIGYHIFGLAIMDGYHSMLLTIDNNNPCDRKYILSDQNPLNSDYNYTNGWKEFNTGTELDEWITHKTKSWHSKKDSYAGTEAWKIQK